MIGTTKIQFSILYLISFIALMAVSAIIYLQYHQISITAKSLILYTNYQSPETITNWIVDTNTSEKWEVGKGFAVRSWSPLGKYLAFHTLSPLPFEIWVSDNMGRNMYQVLDSTKFPDLEIKGYAWLTDEEIIVNVVKDAQAFAYLLNINTLDFEQIPNSTSFTYISPKGQFWVELDLQSQYSLFNLDGKRTQLIIDYWHYYFSPHGNQVAYSCAGKEKFSSLCIADISMNGFANEHKIAEDVLINAFGEMVWSLDGKYIGFLYSSEETRDTKFQIVDISNGTNIYDWLFPTTTTRNFWSPHNDKVIDFNGLMLDLKTGQVTDFFSEINEEIPSYIVDWRLIPSQ